MINSLVYEALDSLAEKYIPEGRHKELHVNSREMWVELVAGLIEKGYLTAKLSVLKKCAVHWETLLVQKLSILN